MVIFQAFHTCTTLFFSFTVEHTVVRLRSNEHPFKLKYSTLLARLVSFKFYHKPIKVMTCISLR